MNRSTPIFVLPLLLTLLSAQVQAEERNFYIGGSLGVSTYDLNRKSRDVLGTQEALRITNSLPEERQRAIAMRGSLDPEQDADVLRAVAESRNAISRAKIDESAFVYKGFAGVTLHENFGLEFGYFGSDYDVQFRNTDYDGNLTGFTYSALLRYPAHQLLDVFLKLGGATWELDSDNPGLDDDETSFMVGVGVEYEFGNELGLRAEWERILISGEDISLYTVGLEYDFPM